MSRRKLVRWSIVIGVLLLVAALVPFLIPSSVLVPRVESLASEKLGVPVRIGSLHVFVFPLPHLKATDLRVGKSDVSVSAVSIHPQLLSLFSEQRVLRLVEIEGLSFTDGVFALLKPKGGPAAVAVRRVVVRDLRPQMKGQAMGAWDVELDLAENQRV